MVIEILLILRSQYLKCRWLLFVFGVHDSLPQKLIHLSLIFGQSGNLNKDTDSLALQITHFL